MESQIEDAGSRRPEAAPLTPEQRERRLLELSRKRILHDLESAKNPRYREQLKAALAYLDEKLKN